MAPGGLLLLILGSQTLTLVATRRLRNVYVDRLTDVDEVRGEDELSELYRDMELLAELERQNSSLGDSRQARGLLGKLNFLTGLRLGSFITSSGTLAASQSIRILGKVMNAALSVSYGEYGVEPFVPIVDPGFQGLGPADVAADTVVGDDEPVDNATQGIRDMASANLTGSVPEIPHKAINHAELIAMHNEEVDRLNNLILKSRATNMSNSRTPRNKADRLIEDLI